MDERWDALVALVRTSGATRAVRAVVLAGSWARGEADRASDVDLLALTDRGPRAVQAGRFRTVRSRFSTPP